MRSKRVSNGVFLRRSAGINATTTRPTSTTSSSRLPALSGEAYTFRYENAGNIENEGVEVSLSAYPVYGSGLTWQSVELRA